MDILDNILDVLKAPIVGDLDLTHLFLLVGVVMVCIIAWGFILHHMKLAATELV